MNKKGFTLIELLVVVLIIGILAAVALPQYTTAVEKSRSAEALTLMDAIAKSAERYRLQKDEWPSNFNNLDIEVPKAPGSTSSNPIYGGRNFTMTMGAPSGNASSTFVIVAARNLTTSGKIYNLKTVLTEGTDGTISMKRSCGGNASTTTDTQTALTSGSDAEKACFAITSGHDGVGTDPGF